MMKKLVAILIAVGLLTGCASTRVPGVVHVRGEIRGGKVDVPFESGLTLARAIASAGGFTDFRTAVRVDRQDKTVLFVKGTHELDKPENLEFLLEPGDIVFVRPMF